jgi:hypothetical protein
VARLRIRGDLLISPVVHKESLKRMGIPPDEKMNVGSFSEAQWRYFENSCFLYSLYDALVSISVPSDKARAVVDAMERDMSTTLATKQDLQLLATKEEMLLLKQDVAVLRHELGNRFALQDQKIDTLELRLTVKLGSMLIVGFGLTIAAMRLWV